MHWDWGRRRPRAALTCAAAAAVSVALAALAGCTAGTPGATAGTPTTASLSPSATHSSPAASPRTSDSSPAAPYGACVAQVYNKLTLAQRVGQLFLVGVTDDIAGPVTTGAVNTYHFGSLLMNATTEGVSALAAATAHMQTLAPANGGVRFFIAANQEGGAVQQLTGPGFSVMPAAVVQGTWTTSALRAAAETWGRQLRAAGVNFDLAPVMDVVPAGTAASNAPIGALGREFGSTPAGNGASGAAFIAGMTAAGVATSAKHFPGLGRVTGNTDFTANVVDTVTTPNDPYLGSFRAAVAGGAPFVMVALATYTKIDPSELAVFSPTVMRLVRSTSGSGLGFRGVIMSDDIGDAVAVQSIAPATRAISFLTAGGDMITSQSIAPAEPMAAAVLAKATSDASFRAIVDDAVQRVLAAKQAYGLLPC